MSQKVEKVQKGGRGQHKKSKSPKFGLFDKMWGRLYFYFFPNVNVDFKCFRWTKNKLVLKWFLGNFECFKLMFFLLRGGGLPKFKIFPISNFSQIRSEGRGHQISNFPTFKKVQNILREGGVKKIVDFFHFLWHFLIRRLPLAIAIYS